MTILCSLLLTPLIMKLAYKIGAVDYPNKRKVHQKVMPRLGGLAIYIAFLFGSMWFHEELSTYFLYVWLGSVMIICVGILDDKYGLSAKTKFCLQLAIAIFVVVGGDIHIKLLDVPFGGKTNLGYLSIPVSVIWVVALMNAINLIDGLDGLAAGVSAIALSTISILAFSTGNIEVGVLSLILVCSILGFLKYNFYPAKIFMGDTGSLFLGYMIGVISLMNFKNVTFFSLIIPIVLLAVPIGDTFFAIIRRIVNNRPLSAPDKSHLHHCLLNLGYSHRKTVIIIYVISGLFSIAALCLSKSLLWSSLVILGLLILFVEIGVEVTGLVSKNYKPLLNVYYKMKLKLNKQ